MGKKIFTIYVPKICLSKPMMTALFILQDYLLCSHLFPEDLGDVHMFLKHHSLLNLVNKERVENIVIWREIFPTRLCHRQKEDRPGYREPTGRWFLLVVIMVSL